MEEDRRHRTYEQEDRSAVVEKSRPLVYVQKGEARQESASTPAESKTGDESKKLTLGELKLVDTYLARINARDTSTCNVVFTLNEYEELLGIDRVRADALEKRTRDLLGTNNVVTVPTANGWDTFVFLSCCKYNRENGTIEITCSEEAKKYIFNITKFGYIKYKLKYILQLKNRYAYYLYMYILDNKFRGRWIVDLDKLREEILRCDIEYYKEYKYFRRDVLDKAVSEMNAKTDIKVRYVAKRSGRTVSKIQFEIDRTIADIQETEVSRDDLAGVWQGSQGGKYKDEDDEKHFVDSRLEFYAEAVDNTLTEIQMRVLVDILLQIYPNPGDQLERYDLLMHSYHEMKAQAERHTIRDPYLYLKTILEARARALGVI